MFEKTRIRFNSYVFTTLATLFLRYPIFMNVTLPFWFTENSYDRRRKDITIRWTYLET